MNCTRYERDAALLAGGDLPPAKAACFEQHLVGCSECRGRVDALRDVRAALAGLRQEPIPAEVYAAIRSAVWERLDASPQRHPSWAWPLSSPALRLRAAALVLLVLGAGAAWLLIRAPHAGDRTGPPAVTRTLPPLPTHPAAPGAVEPAGPAPPRVVSAPVAAPASPPENPQRTTPLPRWQLVESPPARSGQISPAAITPATIQPARIQPPASSDPLVIRLIADDEAVTIVWLAETQGGTP